MPLVHSECTLKKKGTIMIDTIRLFTREFDIAGNNKFQTQTLADYSTGEVQAEKLFCNIPGGGRFNIKPQGAEKCLLFEASLPKLLYNTSLKELESNDFEKCLSAIQGQFMAAGAVIDKSAFESLPVSRLDYCRNIEVEHSIVDYLFLLKNCSFGGRNRTSWKTETVTFFNKSQELCIYNKVLEVKQDDKQAAAAGVRPDSPENILRIESRMKAADVVQRAIKRRTFSECFDFGLAKQKLLTDFETIVLNIGQQTTLNFNDDIVRLKELREKSRYSWSLFIAEKGIPLFLMQYQYDLELIKKLLFETYQRRQVYYILKGLKIFIAEHRTPKERNLISEIRLKLAA